jgi:NADH:ubiquinone oxidoreductase subunit C
VAGPQHGVVALPPRALPGLAQALRLEASLGGSFLVEASALDLGLAPSPLAYYLFHSSLARSRLTVVLGPGAQSALDSVFPNANWLERELSEMYGVYLGAKLDSRSLLLDYAGSDHPMLKSFPCTGQGEVGYGLLTESVQVQRAEAVEL